MLYYIFKWRVKKLVFSRWYVLKTQIIIYGKGTSDTGTNTPRQTAFALKRAQKSNNRDRDLVTDIKENGNVFKRTQT